MLSPLSSLAPRRAAGTGLSALLHLAAVAIVIFGLPDLRLPARSETVIPVEILQLPEPEPQPEPPAKPETAEASPKAPTQPSDRARPTLEDVRPDQSDKGDAGPQEASRTDKPADGADKSDDKSTVMVRWVVVRVWLDFRDFVLLLFALVITFRFVG